ncbi:MAG: ECF transporter S component [Lachnospiraceae bacterium]|nr:ECF transporter S component [Lachnospiraceae bacterium]MDD3617355.1 ECF transporter S component [Lachnospiraceae bacterium]
MADLPAVLMTFMMGPVEGFMVAFIKILLKLVVKGTETVFVGELASLIGTASYIFPAAFVYHRKKGKSGAVFAMLAGTVFVSLTSLIGNAYLVFPAFARLYGMSLDTIIAMGTVINKNITDIYSLMIFAILPFNLIKYTILSVVTFFTYKRLKNIIFK